MTESMVTSSHQLNNIFIQSTNAAYKEINILQLGIDVLIESNISMGLALSIEEINYLFDSYVQQQRNITDVELMMFAQTNSEHLSA